MNKLRFKPYYLYGLVLIIIIVILYFSSESNNPSSKLTSSNIAENNLPNDEMHKNLGMQQPGKSNVNSDIYKKMNELKKNADSSPTDTLKIREYADFLLAAHKPDEAITYYNKILKINKKRKDILTDITLAYYNKGDFKSAEETVLQTLKLYPDDPEVNYNLGVIKASTGNADKAREIWKRIIEKYPDSEISNLAKNSLDKL